MSCPRGVAVTAPTNRTRSLSKLAPGKTPLDGLGGCIADSRLASELAALEEQGISILAS
jgi:hypothetical protein